jgi:hypothetical protein
VEFGDVEGAGVGIENQYGGQKAHIADAGYKESLLGSSRRRRAVEPEAD